MLRSKPGQWLGAGEAGDGAAKELNEGESEGICQGQDNRVRLNVRLKVKTRVYVRGGGKVYRVFVSRTG